MRKKRLEKPLALAAGKYKYIYMVTFTIKQQAGGLKKSLLRLKSGLRAFQQAGSMRSVSWARKDGSRSIRKYRRGGQWANVQAGFMSIEILSGATMGLWNTHAHALLFCEKPLDYSIYDQDKKAELHARYGRTIPEKELNAITRDRIEYKNDAGEKSTVPLSPITREWYDLTGSVNVDVIPLKNPFQKSPLSSYELAAACDEIVKYSTKFSPRLLENDLPEIIDATWQERFFFRYGDDFKISESMAADETEQEQERFFLQWNKDTNSYDPAPIARIRDYRDKGEDCRKKTAVATGFYRRARRDAVEDYLKSGLRIRDKLYNRLDTIKQQYRLVVKTVWQSWRPPAQEKPPPAPASPEFTAFQLSIF